MKEPNENPKGRGSSFLISYLFVSILLMHLVSSYLLAPMSPRDTSYSAFLESVDAGRVKEVSIGADEIVWTEIAPQQEGQEEESSEEVRVRFRTDRIPGMDDSEILERMEKAGVEFLGRVESQFLTQLLGLLLPVALLAGFWYWMYSKAGGAATKALSIGNSRAKIWDQASQNVTFADVAGIDESVDELREVVDFLVNREKYARIGARVPKGILLSGPPGTGKTLLARATAGEAKVPFFSLSGADFVEMFVGVGAARVRDLFKQARSKAPCIVFIDEIDAIGRARGSARSPVSNDEREQTLNQLLVEMDGFDSSEGVIIMAATNRPDVLDKALLRPGRFDRQVTVDAPDLNGREAILKVHARKVKLSDGVDLRAVAGRSPGFAGADLANLVNEAALLAVRRGKESVEMEDFDEAVDRVVAGLERKNRAVSERERRIVAYHEMGHALVGFALPNADPVRKVSIIPRGSAALGVTIQAPLEDRFLHSEEDLKNRLCVLLAGRAAEMEAFGEVTTGSSDDLQRATDLARRMVGQFGFSEKVGLIALDSRNGSGPEAGLYLERPYGDHTAKTVDEEVRRLIEDSFERARTLIRENDEAFRKAAELLLKKEVLDGTELRRALEDYGFKSPTTDTDTQSPHAEI